MFTIYVTRLDIGWGLWNLINNVGKQIDLLIRAESIKEDLKRVMVYA